MRLNRRAPVHDHPFAPRPSPPPTLGLKCTYYEIVCHKSQVLVSLTWQSLEGNCENLRKYYFDLNKNLAVKAKLGKFYKICFVFRSVCLYLLLDCKQ